MGSDGRLRVRLSADYERLEFLRVLRSHQTPPLTDPGGLVAPASAAVETMPKEPADR